MKYSDKSTGTRRDFLKTSGLIAALSAPVFGKTRKELEIEFKRRTVSFVPSGDVERLLSENYQSLRSGESLVLRRKHSDSLSQAIAGFMKSASDYSDAGGRYFTRDNASIVREYPGNGAYNLYSLEGQAHVVGVPSVEDLGDYLGEIPWTIDGAHDLGGKINRTWGYNGEAQAPQDVRDSMASEFAHTTSWRLDNEFNTNYGESEWLGYTWVAEDASLPVTLTSFSATGGDEHVDLDWRVESEINNLGFNIYRRRKGSGDGFRKANRILIPGRGSTSVPKDYSWTDTEVKNGVTYEYAISDLDYAGVETVHGMIAEATPGEVVLPPNRPDIIKNYPNPFNPSTTIEFYLPREGEVTMTVHNVLGQLVEKLLDGKEYSPGKHRVSWTAGADDPSGLYIIRLMTPFGGDTQRSTLIK